MSDKMYAIGQILYLIKKDVLNVIPVRVTRKISEETLEGVSTMHIVTTVDEKVFCIDDGKELFIVYDSPEHVKHAMVSKVTASINAIVDHAEETALKRFGADRTMPREDEPTIVVLPDGNKAKVNIKLSNE